MKVSIDDNFRRAFSQVKDTLNRAKVQKQIVKLTRNPKAGKPMRYERKGTRELYIKPFRLSYVYVPSEDKIVLLDLYHKKQQ